jgi:hypothetical protein
MSNLMLNDNQTSNEQLLKNTKELYTKLGGSSNADGRLVGELMERFEDIIKYNQAKEYWQEILKK